MPVEEDEEERVFQTHGIACAKHYSRKLNKYYKKLNAIEKDQLLGRSGFGGGRKVRGSEDCHVSHREGKG